jgi:shikimate dehydrogenase
MTIDATTRLAGVLGWPVSHSRSPRLHNFWLERYGINGAYLPLPASPGHFPTAMRGLVALGFAGANVTLPHKQAAFALCDTVEPFAARVSAVNTLTISEAGAIAGSNTDGFGFLAALREAVPQLTLANATAVVLGAGGAARAVVAALADTAVAEIRLINRTAERAELLAADLGIRVRIVPWRERHGALAGAQLLVNTTALGMAGQPALDIALDGLPEDGVVYDLVYVPLETALLAEARRRGHRVVDGLGMLLHQARPGFRSWFGRDPEIDDALRQHVAADLLPGPAFS